MTNSGSHLFARLYFDEDVHKGVSNSLRTRGFDAVSAHEVGQIGISDQQQLEYAISQGRLLVTFNVSDYVKLGKEYMALGKRHYGIIVSRQLPIGEMVKKLLRLLNEFTADELDNNIWWL